MSNSTEFSTSAGHRVIKNQTNLRVSREAGKQIVEDLEDYGTEIARKAKEFAEHSGRKTIREEDVRKAVREVN